MSVVEIKKSPMSPKKTIRQIVTLIQDEGGPHYDAVGDVLLITLDKENEGISVYSTLDTLETLGLLKLADNYILGE